VLRNCEVRPFGVSLRGMLDRLLRPFGRIRSKPVFFRESETGRMIVMTFPLNRRSRAPGQLVIMDQGE